MYDSILDKAINHNSVSHAQPVHRACLVQCLFWRQKLCSARFAAGSGPPLDTLTKYLILRFYCLMSSPVFEMNKRYNQCKLTRKPLSP